MSRHFQQCRVIDVDTHITEPADLWTSRVPARYRDRVPQMKSVDGRDYWFIDGVKGLAPGQVTMVGFNGRPPETFPSTFAELPASAYDAKARLALMDAESIYAQVIYPNVGGFGSQNFLSMDDSGLKLACVQAYNDFLTEWTSVNPQRLLAVTALPFWDLELSLKEIRRCADAGHRSILFPSQPQDFDQPELSNAHWDPLWATAQEMGLAISFHIGGQKLLGVKEGEFLTQAGRTGIKANFARVSALTFIGNALGIAEIICGGVCHRFPKLNFVSVESGAGWVPTLLESLDWQWHNAGVAIDRPELDLLPSEYFRRQIFACFWFERSPILNAALQMYPDNMMYETDYPHPTSMYPGPATIAQHPADYAQAALGGLAPDLVKKILETNAARVYHVA